MQLNRFLFKILLIFSLSMLYNKLTPLFCQSPFHTSRIGINFGIGSQRLFPFNNPHYDYSSTFIKATYSLPFVKRKIISANILIEPGYYNARHQLLNEFFVRPESGPDHREKAAIFIQKKTIHEFALNIGVRLHFNLSNKTGVYLYGSVGPMYMDKETERLSKGFAFSDFVGIGFSLNFGKTVLEVRPTLRHVSNADLQLPNVGHNSTNVEIGVSWPLGNKKDQSFEENTDISIIN